MQPLGSATLSAADPSSRDAFQNGTRLEGAGDLIGSLEKYQMAMTSPFAPVHDAAAQAIDRVNGKLDLLGGTFEDLRALANWSQRIRLALGIAIIFGILIYAVSRLTRRRGTEIRRFTVIPEYEQDFSIRFDRLLLEEIARIAHVYQSDQLRRIGAAVTISNTKGDQELQGLAAIMHDAAHFFSL
jgi:hypothetical protein